MNSSESQQALLIKIEMLSQRVVTSYDQRLLNDIFNLSSKGSSCHLPHKGDFIDLRIRADESGFPRLFYNLIKTLEEVIDEKEEDSVIYNGVGGSLCL